jgi:diaminopimelate decarboxylase
VPNDDPSIAELIAARPGLRAQVPDGLLFEGVPLAAIAAAYETPTWVYGAATLVDRARRLRRALPGAAIHYAVKANDHLAVLALLARAGLGADIVSQGEMLRALEAGFPAGRIVFSGVGKTAHELALAAARGIGQINVESAEELAALAAIAAALPSPVKVALRVNPDVDAGTHAKISTGRRGDKFGIAAEDVPTLYAHAATLPGIALHGLAMHIGSQIFTMAPYRAAYGRMAALVRDLRAAGLPVPAVDCGGGLGVPYQNQPAPLPEAWAGAIAQAFGGLDVALAIEPGRWIAAPAGVLLARVIRTRRHGVVRPIVVLDAAMNELLRPAMYGAWHGVVPVGPAYIHAPLETVDIAGPVCESSDFFARARGLPALADGALVAILDAGAYGAVMSSRYNGRPFAAQVMVEGGRATLIRPRAALESLWSDETVPPYCRPA